jgi:hypothetical protein
MLGILANEPTSGTMHFLKKICFLAKLAISSPQQEDVVKVEIILKKI